jgi:hypothetical protein
MNSPPLWNPGAGIAQWHSAGLRTALSGFVSRQHPLTLALDGGELSPSLLGRFTLTERTNGIHWIGGWVGPRYVVDAVVKRKIPRVVDLTINECGFPKQLSM